MGDGRGGGGGGDRGAQEGFEPFELVLERAEARLQPSAMEPFVLQLGPKDFVLLLERQSWLTRDRDEGEGRWRDDGWNRGSGLRLFELGLQFGDALFEEVGLSLLPIP